MMMMMMTMMMTMHTVKLDDRYNFQERGFFPKTCLRRFHIDTVLVVVEIRLVVGRSTFTDCFAYLEAGAAAEVVVLFSKERERMFSKHLDVSQSAYTVPPKYGDEACYGFTQRATISDRIQR